MNLKIFKELDSENVIPSHDCVKNKLYNNFSRSNSNSR